jgi:hypothetical protein
MILSGQADVIARWVEARVPGYRSFDTPAGFGILREGRLAAGVVFHNYDARAGDMEVVIAAESPRWASRGCSIRPSPTRSCSSAAGG